MQPSLKGFQMKGYAQHCAIAFGILALLCVEPALANKFETIGGGVSGSSGIKRDWLQKFFLVVGGMSLLSAVLALVDRRDLRPLRRARASSRRRP